MATAPPESSKAVTMRSRIVFSFWAVILLLGIPMWWQTTSIYRASLPTDRMLDSVSPPLYPVQVGISAPALSSQDAQVTIQKTQSILDSAPRLPNFNIQCELLSTAPEGQFETDLRIRLEPQESYGLDLSSGVVHYNAAELENLPARLAGSIQDIYADEQAMVAYMLAHQGANNDQVQAFVQTLTGEIMHKTGKNAARAVNPSPRYSLTFSLFTAGASPSSWDIQPAIEQYIQPIVHALSSAVNISIATQVQLYSTFAPSIQPHQTENGFVLRQEDLTSFINAAEWPLSPSLGTGPTINFILYVPAKQQLPLKIENSEGNSWLIPQWGGIAILNPPLFTNPETERQHIIDHLDHDLLASSFITFRSYLLSLLGMPQSPLPLEHQLGAFKRLAALSLYLRARSNLGSLARLAQHLNSIPIPRHVLQLVEKALGNLEKYRNKPVVGASRDAFAASEKAFFDKSMVGQVYFPDEHKVAVYLPLLGPIGVPLVVGLIKQLKRLKSGN